MVSSSKGHTPDYRQTKKHAPYGNLRIRREGLENAQLVLFGSRRAGFLADYDDIALDGLDDLLPIGGGDGGWFVFVLHCVDEPSWR